MRYKSASMGVLENQRSSMVLQREEVRAVRIAKVDRWYGRQSVRGVQIVELFRRLVVQMVRDSDDEGVDNIEDVDGEEDGTFGAVDAVAGAEEEPEEEAEEEHDGIVDGEG